MTVEESSSIMQDGYVEERLSEEELARQVGSSRPLADSVRALVDALITTDADPDVLEEVRHEVDRLAARLDERRIGDTFGVRFGRHGKARAWGNAVIGLRNAVAPPLRIVHEPDGLVWAETVLGRRYEGPPGLVHGGVSALLLDQMVGEAATAAGAPGMTAGLDLRYHAPTPLGPVRLEARVERVEGVKTHVRGWTYVGTDGERRLCVEAEGLMILPRWAREHLARENASAADVHIETE